MKLPPPRKNLFAQIAFIAVVCFSGLVQANSRDPSTAANGDLIVVKAPKPIKDATGNIRHIVDLIDEVDKNRPARFADADSKIRYQKGKSDQLIAEVTKGLNLDIFGSTSLVGTSFVAYLTATQVEQFTKDKRVKLITQDSYLQPSALWNSTQGSEHRSWGLYAIGAANAESSNGYATVYVLDTGVEMHADLSGMYTQLSAINGINPVGCYPHATHVAGIIGAASNGIGTVGVLPNVKIVSISINEVNLSVNGVACSDNYSEGSIGLGLEKIMVLVLQSTKVGIVNLSFNDASGGGAFSTNSSNGMKMQALATPTYELEYGVGYKGALIVQSAGNQYQNANGHAYNAANPYDGILVVGGLDENGQAVRPMLLDHPNPLPGFYNVGALERGSNYGSAVELWAPSQRIYSTWGQGGYHELSGTSMAAPFVAGLAARALEGGNIHSSIALEQVVRGLATALGGSGHVMPHLYSLTQTALPTVEISLFEGDTSLRTSIGSLQFSVFNEANNSRLRFDSIGASGCSLLLNGAYAAYLPLPWSTTAANLRTDYLPQGYYTWQVTCQSAVGTTNSASALGYIIGF